MKALKITLGTLLLFSKVIVAQVDTVYTDTTTRVVREPQVVVVTPPAPQVVPQQTEKEEPPFKSGEFGIRFMPGFSQIDARNSQGGTVEGDFVVGYGYGALLALNSRHIGIQLEAIYNPISQKYKDGNMERTLHIDYVNIPLLLTLNTNKSKPVNLSVAVGPQVGINVGSRFTTEGTNNVNGNGPDTLQAVLAVKQSDFGVAYGAGLEFALNPRRTFRFNLGFRGVYGLIDIDDNSQTKATNEYFLLDRTNRKSYAGYIGLSVLF